MPDGHATRNVDPQILAAARAGLTATPKTLPPALFYDAAGCALFGQITELPEYYVTRTEMALLREAAPVVGAMLPEGLAVVEYGASSATKAAVLLRGLRAPALYVPVDVAAEALDDVTAEIGRDFPRLAVRPVAGDFLRRLSLPASVQEHPRLAFFPGSTIGNFEPEAAAGFLRVVAAALGGKAHLLIGVDRWKDPAILVPAYDDGAGVTAAFNMNMLVRLNREAGADFDLTRFRHAAIWNADASRIEMHLISLCDQDVRLGDSVVSFAEGESIHTESSYKHRPEAFVRIAESGGWSIVRSWTDAGERFAIHLMRTGD